MRASKRNCLFFLIIIALFQSACERQETVRKQEELPVAEVATATVAKKVAGKQVEVVGTVQAVQQAEISSKISGNIITLPVNLGTRVKEGELLVELSAEEVSAQVQQARAQLGQAQRNLAREEGLLKKRAATEETVKSMRDSVRIAAAAYKEASTMFQYARISAPFSGIITRKIANIGDLAIPGKPLLYMEKENNLQVLTYIPEAMILKIKKGDRLPVNVPSVDLAIDGTVDEVSPIAEISSRSAPIKLNLAANPRLRSGQFARITLPMEQEPTLMVPRSAVLSFGQMERVFVVSDNKAQLRLVRTGVKDQDQVEILSGLEDNETIVTKGNQTLLDGQPVTLRQ